MRTYGIIIIKKEIAMKKVKFTTTLNEELLTELKIQSIREKTSVSNILEMLIEEYLFKQCEKSSGLHSEQ